MKKPDTWSEKMLDAAKPKKGTRRTELESGPVDPTRPPTKPPGRP
jgi:hypothetical protein